MPICRPVRRSFSEESGSGTFRSLGVLPRRSRDTSNECPAFNVTTLPSTGPSRSSSTSRSSSPRPQLPGRDALTPTLISNGKPLKSSLKSSSTPPAISTTSLESHIQHMKLHSRSEPSTPKNVHFPEKDYALAIVHVFNRSTPPALTSNGNDDATEIEGEDALATRFPFPPLSSAFNYEIDPTKSSPVPSKFSSANLLLESLNPSSSSFSSTSLTTKPSLTGSILVRNLAFEKHVAIRFTLDDWQTVSEVGAHYVNSLSLLPSEILPLSSSPSPADPSSCRERGWDRFTFTIRLEDHVYSLSTRTLWLAARYRIDSMYPVPGSSQYGPGGEWWDNNGGRNYRVGFRPVVTAPTSSRSKPRRESVCAPIPSPRTQPQPPKTCKEHVLGLIVPSVPDHKEDRRLTPPGTGKLDLCNYPPTISAISSISIPSEASPQSSSSSSITNPPFSPSTALRSLSDEDTASPASSTLSTPAASPTIVPRVIMAGHSSEKDDIVTSSKSGHIADWDWLATSEASMKESSRPHVDLVPRSESPERRCDTLSPAARKALCNSSSAHDAFVTQRCFAKGPSPNHHANGIMA